MHLVMFDIDGTLTQSNAVDADCYASAIEDVLNLPPIDRDWSRYRCVTDSGIAAEIIETRFGRAPLGGELQAIRRRFVEGLEATFANDPSTCRPIQGAAEMLARLAERRDVAIALATGGWAQSAQFKCRVAGLAIERFAFASCDDSDVREEVMSIAQSRAAALYGVSTFDACVYVGDGIWDWVASCRLGIPFIGLGEGLAIEILKRKGERAFLSDYTDYPRFLELLGLAVDGTSTCG
jgi:phosphoglycolate phosphatase-like HAD superfamily hydrolase